MVADCPRCGKASRYVEKEWRYDVYDAKSFYCKECGMVFVAYFKDSKLSHTRPSARATACWTMWSVRGREAATEYTGIDTVKRGSGSTLRRSS